MNIGMTTIFFMPAATSEAIQSGKVGAMNSRKASSTGTLTHPLADGRLNAAHRRSPFRIAGTMGEKNQGSRHDRTLARQDEQQNKI